MCGIYIMKRDVIRVDEERKFCGESRCLYSTG